MANVWISDTPGAMLKGPSVIAGEDVTSGQLLYIKDADGLAYKADADDAAKRPCIGAAFEDASAGEAVSVVTYGFRNDGTTVAEGGLFYLSATAGGFTQTAAGTEPQVVGYGYTTVKWVFYLQLDYNVPS